MHIRLALSLHDGNDVDCLYDAWLPSVIVWMETGGESTSALHHCHCAPTVLVADTAPPVGNVTALPLHCVGEPCRVCKLTLSLLGTIVGD